MANRYWVGGTADWDPTAGTKWATTSGGAGGASVPTVSDDVFFDANSGTGVVTTGGGYRPNAGSLTFTGFTGSFAGGSQIALVGNLTLSPTMTHVNAITYQMEASSGFYTITSAGKTIATLQIGTSGVRTATWTLQDALTLTGELTVNSGTFSTNNFDVVASAIVSTNSNVRAINLGSSTVTLSTGANATNFQTNTNLTFNAGTSNIIITASGVTLRGGSGSSGVTFYNVSFTSNSPFSNRNIEGRNTFNNLSIAGGDPNSGLIQVTFNENQTINGTLSVSGTTPSARILFRSDSQSTRRTLTLATAGTLTNVDFRDIAISGAASPLAVPFGVGDSGNNTGITWNTQTAYWIDGTGNWTDGTKWSLSSGGAAANGIPQSTNSVVFDAGSDAGSIFTVTIGATVSLNDLTASSLDFTMTLAGSGQLNIYGSVFFPATNFTYTSNADLFFLATTTGKTITTNGVSLTSSLTFDGAGGAWTLSSALSVSGTITINRGTFNTGNQAVSCQTFSSSGTDVRAINLGSSTLTVNFTNIDFTATTNLTFNAGTSTIIHSATSGSFFPGGLTFYNYSMSVNVSFDRAISGSGTFNNLTIQKPSGVGTQKITFTPGSTITINGIFSLPVASEGARIRRTFLYCLGGQATISAASVNLVDANFHNIIAAGAAAPFTGTNLGNVGNNTNITFAAAKTVYWNLITGGDWASTAWATTSGGTPDLENFPLPQDNPIIGNTGLNASATINIPARSAWNANLSTRTLAMTLTVQNATYLLGNLSLATNVTVSASNLIQTFNNPTVTSAGKILNFDIYSGLTLADNLTTSSVLILRGGTLNLNGFSATIPNFIGTGTAVKTITSGTTGRFILTGTGNVWNAAASLGLNTNIVIATQSGAVTFGGNGGTYNSLTLGNGTNSTAQVTIQDNNTFNTISSNLFGGTLLLTAGTSQMVNNFTYSGYKDTPYNVVYAGLTSTSTTAANIATPPVQYYGTFNGSTQYITGPSGVPAYHLSNFDFTIEAWVNYSAVTNSGIVSKHDSVSSGDWGWYYSSATSKFRIIGNNGATIIESSATWVPTVGTWYHIAVTRSGNNFYFFVDGVQLGTTQVNAIVFTYTSTILTYIARMSDGLNFNGSMSNVRLVKGTGAALYTSNFTPPTAPLTAITGTQLLTLRAATIVDNSPNGFTLTNNGTVAMTAVTYPQNTNYLKVSYVNATPVNAWNALSSLSVIGTNTNWKFSGYTGMYGYTDAGNPIENKYVTKDYITEYYPDLIPSFITGVVWGSGSNNIGQLGDGTIVAKTSPVTMIGKSAGWRSVSLGGFNVAGSLIDQDNNLWTTGYTPSTGTSTSSPTLALTAYGAQSNWKQTDSGGWSGSGFTMGIKTDGTLWGWGNGSYNGTGTTSGSPKTVLGGGTNWKQVSAYYQSAAAVKTDGTLWTWGQNTYGALGDGTTATRSSPGTTAGGGTNWKQVACGYYHMAAVKTDGTLWTWGGNTYGALGDGTTTSKTSPGTTAGGGTNWKQVSIGNYNSAAIKTDGTLWTWGNNSSGALGDGTTTSKTSPGTTAGGGTNWKKVFGGYDTFAAIKTDGTLWTWGVASTYMTGAVTSSPKSVTGISNWKTVALAKPFSSYNTLLGIASDV